MDRIILFDFIIPWLDYEVSHAEPFVDSLMKCANTILNFEYRLQNFCYAMVF